MKCYNCGATLPDGAKVCLACGHRIGEKNVASSTHFEGERESLDSSKKREGKRVVFPPVLRWMFSIVLIFLLVAIFFYFK